MIGNYKIIAFITCRIHERECHEFISVLDKHLKEMGCRLFVYNFCSYLSNETKSPDPQTEILDQIDPSFVDAVIIHSERIKNTPFCNTVAHHMLSLSVPVISLGESFEGCMNVEYEHEAGIKEIVGHLIKVHSITDFHMIAGTKGDYYSEKRIDVFKTVLKENNIAFDENMLSYGDYWSLPAIEAVQKLISENRLPRAIVCANDNMAIAVLDFLRSQDIKVPETVAVTGYDCINTIYSSSPTVTSAAINSESITKTICDTLKDIFCGKKRSGSIRMLPEAVFNESCGCQCQNKTNSAVLLNEETNMFYRFQDENIVLSNIAEKIQRCGSFEEVAYIFRSDDLMYAMCCLIKKEYADESINPETRIVHSPDDELYVLYDSDMIDYKKLHNERFSPYYMPEREIIPTLDYYLNDGRCLIFSSLHYLGVAFGYVCFHFDSHISGNYYKIPQTVNMLNNALGGLLSLRHKHYLMGRIEKMSWTDPLTGLYNRRGFCTEYAKFAFFKGSSLAVIMCDLDGLKYINDTFGHEAGDNAIHTVALALKNACPKNAICTRFGGDEMMAVYLYNDDETEIRTGFEKYLENYNEKSGKPYKVAASMGFYIADRGEYPSFEELVKKSDELMYKAKRERKMRK